MAIITPLLLLFKNPKAVKRNLTPGLVSSTFLSLLFVLIRKIRPICHYVPSEDAMGGCYFDWKEVELFMFFMCLMVLKNRSAISLEQMVTTTLMYAKLANTYLFYRLDPRLAFVYGLLCLVRVWLFPENFVEGPEELTYFNDKTLEDVLQEDPKVTWVIQFFTTWSPPCRAASPTFSAMSNEYASEYLRFGRIDVGKYPQAAQTYGVNASTMSRQLPTIIVFENGKPADWRPMIGSNKKFIKYVFSEENMKRDFGFNKLYEESLAKSKTFKKSKKNE